jgi:hypothetical protein
MRGARIDGDLDFDRASLTNPGGIALNAAGISVRQAALYRDGFHAQGQVSLLGGSIGGPLEFDRASMTNPGNWVLMLQDLRAAVLVIRNLAGPLESVSLITAKVGTLVDDAASWPNRVDLTGFTYDVLYEDRTVTARRRLGWLSRNPSGYVPQPYEQLASVYRRAGRDEDARIVAIAKQRARRKTLSLPRKAWSLMLDSLVGYGYRTWLAGVWLFGFVVVGWAVFDRAYPAHMTSGARPAEPQPTFQPMVYALDTLLPVVDLRQQNYWIPEGGAQWWAWISILAGWVLTTAVVAALTGLLKRE